MDQLTGTIFRRERVLTQDDFDQFARLSGDHNPIHVDPDFSRSSKFGATVAHGMFLYSLISGTISHYFPGMKQLYQTFMFLTPTYAGEKIQIRLEVLNTIDGGYGYELQTNCIRPNGEYGCQGTTQIINIAQGSNLSEVQPINSDRPISDAPSIKGIKIGQAASLVRKFTREDVLDYSRLADDANPVFRDIGYAQKHGYEDLVVPGGLLGGMISTLLGTRLPGGGTNWLKQKYSFNQQAYVNQNITATVEVSRIRQEKWLVNLETTCKDHQGELIFTGDALVQVQDVPETEDLRDATH